MPMPRLFGVGLSVLMVLSTFVGQVLSARPAAAQSVTTTTNAELRSGPGYDYPVLSSVPAGSPITIDGPPAAEFYPVTVNGQSGWLHGAILNIVKDTTALVAGVGSEATMAPVSGWEAEQAAAQEVPAGDQAATGTSPPATETTTDPATDTTAAPATATATTPDAPVSQNASGAVELPSGAPAATGTTTTEPTEQTGSATAVPETTPLPSPVPSPVPSPLPTATPEPVSTGQASVPNGGNLYYAPDPNSGVVFWVPAGSTVWRLGERQNGYVKADYMAMVGWIAADLLAEPVPVTAEVIPETAPMAEDVRTPRPGSGVAFTTVELALRAGPSASQPALDVVPAGKRVIMTGVMENGFHRVDYQGTLGWVASDYLSTPPNPTEVADEDDPAFRRIYDRTYTRDQIVDIIYAAADRYGQSRSDMLRVAECESALDPYAVHPSGSYGLFQFIRTTWKSTPYGDQNVFDPKANSNAAAWMWAQGRRSEWVCK